MSSLDQAESNTQAASAAHPAPGPQGPDEPARVPASGGQEGGVRIYRAIAQYTEDLRAKNEHCFRPRENGEPCFQCYERERVIAQLKHILAQERN